MQAVKGEKESVGRTAIPVCHLMGRQGCLPHWGV